MTDKPLPFWKDLIAHSLVGWAMAYLTAALLAIIAGVHLPAEAQGALYVASLATSWLLMLCHRTARPSRRGDGE